MRDPQPPRGVPKTIRGEHGERMFYVATRTLTPTTDKTVKEIVVHTCEDKWLELQKEAEAIVAPRGELITDPYARINAAYARLWLEDNRFQWAGLAAFASKQVGCDMLHAAKLKLEADESEDFSRASMGDPTISDGYAVMAKASSQMLSLLALGNTALFLDIYPLHLFYKRYGIQRYEACQFDRKNIADKVLWPIDPKILPFGRPFLEILQGFRQIDRGELMLAVQSLARHEQLNILQKVLYNRPDMRLLLKSNQAAWVTGIPSGVAAEIELTLSAQCSPVAERTETFPRTLTADLADPNQRMAFVTRGAQHFDMLLNGPGRRDIDQSLRIIATGASLR